MNVLLFYIHGCGVNLKYVMDDMVYNAAYWAVGVALSRPSLPSHRFWQAPCLSFPPPPSLPPPPCLRNRWHAPSRLPSPSLLPPFPPGCQGRPCSFSLLSRQTPFSRVVWTLLAGSLPCPSLSCRYGGPSPARARSFRVVQEGHAFFFFLGSSDSPSRSELRSGLPLRFFLLSLPPASLPPPRMSPMLLLSHALPFLPGGLPLPPSLRLARRSVLPPPPPRVFFVSLFFFSFSSLPSFPSAFSRSHPCTLAVPL